MESVNYSGFHFGGIKKFYGLRDDQVHCFTSILTQFHQKTVQKKIEVMDLLVTSALYHSSF